MPHFDEWGLRPDGLVGPREIPIAVVLPQLPVPTLPRESLQGGKDWREPRGLVSRC